MQLDELTKVIVDTLNEMKAYDVTVLDVKELTSFTDTMIIATGQSDRQVKALANKVLEKIKHSHHEVLGVEGIEQGQWALLDFGDAILHIMHPDTRNYYQLEKLWSVNDREDIKKPLT